MANFTITKSWYKSKTIWGGIIAAIGGLFGVTDPVLVNDAANTAAGFDGSTLAGILAFIGGIVAVIGRATATEKVATPSTEV